MTKKEYNGWYNYETWNIMLWIDNEQAWSEQVREMAVAFLESLPTPEYDQCEIQTFAEQLEAWATDPENGLFPEIPTGPASDALGLYQQEINWEEIAENLLDDTKDDADQKPATCRREIDEA